MSAAGEQISDDGFGFGHLIWGDEAAEGRAAFARRPEAFGLARGVVMNDGIGGVEDDGGGAVIFFEADDGGAGEVAFEVKDVAEFGAAPAVDGLIIVTDDAEVTVFAGELMQEIELQGVGVLIFVNKNVCKLGAIVVADGAMLLEQAQRQEKEVFKIHGISAAQGGEITFPDTADNGGIEGVLA